MDQKKTKQKNVANNDLRKKKKRTMALSFIEWSEERRYVVVAFFFLPRATDEILFNQVFGFHLEVLVARFGSKKRTLTGAISRAVEIQPRPHDIVIHSTAL